MSSKVILTLGTALAGIALCCLGESSQAQEALALPVAADDNDGVDNHADNKDDKSYRRRPGRSGSVVNTDSALLTNGVERLSLAQTSVAEATEAESTVVAQTPTPSPAIDANGNVLADNMLGASEAVNFNEIVVTG